MPALSENAKRFLESQERFSSTVDREEIIASFVANDAPVFEPLIEFQQNYSGYKFMAGLAPIHFGLLQGDGGYPKRTGTAIIEFSQLPETDKAEYLFVCATSEYQMSFELDELGRYYEDAEIVASSFDKAIEHLAIWDEFKNKPDFKVLVQMRQLNISNLDKKLGLMIIPEASDAYTQWYKNESTYLTQCNGFSTIITSADFNIINSQLGLNTE